MYKTTKQANNQGLALVLVIVTLSMLVLIALPFAASNRVENRASEMQLVQAQAEMIAHGAYSYAFSQLTQSCDTMERYAPQKALYKTPLYDSPQEYQINIQIPEHPTQDPKGEIWSVEVKDEQGKININTASPWLMGNIIGSALVSQRVSETATAIYVDSTQGFPDKNGFLWVNGELLRYHHKQDDAFVGCERGLYSHTPSFQDAQTIRAGTLIIDARAHRVVKHRTLTRPFQTVAGIRTIADFSEYAIPAELFARIQPYLTVYSSPVISPWRNPQIIDNDLPGESTIKPDEVLVAESTFYQPGMQVLLQQQNRWAEAIIQERHGNRIVLDRRLQENFTAREATISVQTPHPIHINSAPARVLIAACKGLQAGNDWIDAKEAAILAESIIQRREQQAFQSLEDFQDFLEKLQKKLRQAKVLDQSGRPALTQQEVRALLSAALGVAGKATPSSVSGYQQPFPPLASFCFANEDTYTIAATGIVNHSSGLPLAQGQYERVVRVVPPELLRFSLQTQAEWQFFQEQLRSPLTTTWPNFVKDFEIFPQRTPSPETGVSVASFTTNKENLSGVSYHSHFDFPQTHEGVFTQGSQMPSLPLTLTRDGRQLAPGYVSFWLRSAGTRAGRLQLFEIGTEGKSEDRIVCFYERGRLVLQAFDGTLDDAAAEISAAIALDDKWLHVMAGWQGTAWGELALWVDGEPVGEFRFRQQQQEIKIFTASRIKADDETLVLTSTQGLPPQGAVKIGSEIIEYQGISGNRLQVRKTYQEFVAPSPLARGARGTFASDHPKGALVVPIGYSANLFSEVFPATKLAHDVPEETFFSRLASDLAEKDEILSLTNAKEFPSSGYVAIVDEFSNSLEKVRYSGIRNNKLLQCERGELQTSAASFPQGAFVFPISILVDNHADYPLEGVVQIGNEWMEYERKIDKSILVGHFQQQDIDNFKSSGEFRPLFRSVKGTLATDHDFGTKVLPVFQIQNGSPGRFDQVTLVARNKTKLALEVNWAQGNFVAFTEDIPDFYRPEQLSRLLKFPSGELPSISSLCRLGQKSNFQVDEIKVSQLPSQSSTFFLETVDDNSEEILINHVRNLPREGGILKAGDEYITYQKITGGKLQGVKRGAFGSKAQLHSLEQPYYFIFFVPATSLTKAAGPDEEQISVERTAAFPASGYLRCQNELIGYTNKTSNSFVIPQNQDQQAIFRGAFATQAQSLRQGAIVYPFPVRYWDRYATRDHGEHLAYFSVAKYAPQAHWKKISWQADLPHPDYTKIRILARLDGAPSWDTPVTNQPGGIYAFAEGTGENLINAKGNVLELRIFFPYEQGAFRRGFWKTRALLQELHVSYRQQPIIYEAR